MSKHRDKKRWLKYPLSVYRHWALNQWYYFKKPKLKKWWSKTVQDAIRIVVLITNRRVK